MCCTLVSVQHRKLENETDHKQSLLIYIYAHIYWFIGESPIWLWHQKSWPYFHFTTQFKNDTMRDGLKSEYTNSQKNKEILTHDKPLKSTLLPSPCPSFLAPFPHSFEVVILNMLKKKVQRCTVKLNSMLLTNLFLLFP